MRKLFFIIFTIYVHAASGQVNCNNWLKTPSVPSYIGIGQLNIPGDHVTVEAIINRTMPYSGGQVWAGDIVSKHRDPNDVNYLLRPNSGEITTTNGYYKTPDIADINLNQTYHVAMVYDGDTLKFYRDGCLMSKIHATGDLFQNSWETRIGYYAAQQYPNENFIGYINEVRIWNVARTQQQIQTYMNSSLPNPTTQPGLLAYYTFDDLKNKQGNPAWNGTLGGSASINQTNPNCNAIVNNCPVPPPFCDIAVTKRSDTSICEGSSVNLFASGGTNYQWTPKTGLDNPDISNPVATLSATTTYYITVSNADGCSKTDSVKITVNTLPVIKKSNDTSICANSTVFLFASGGTSYSWFPATGLDNNLISNPKATPSSTTKYYLTVANSAGCDQKDSVKIAVNSLPSISKSNDTSICMNSNVPLFASGGTSYSWSPASSLSNSNIGNPIAKPSMNTVYNVKVTNDEGCSQTASIIVNIKPVAVIAVSPDTIICHNTSVKIFAAGGNGYIWSPAATLNDASAADPLASPQNTTIYYVKITDAQSCVYNDSIKVSVRPASVFSVSADEQICKNANQQLNASGGDIYTWSPANSLDNSNINNPVASPDQTTTYSVTIRENTCNDSATLFTQLTVLPLPGVKAGKSNDINCTQPSVQLTALGALEYSWSPSLGLDNPAIPNPTATPNSSTVYKVTGKDQNGCTNSDSILVKVKYDTNIFYGLPNSFTPNNDGLNDCFGVASWGRISNLDLSIYNQWGQRVFHTNNSSFCWDGSFQGEAQNSGVFVYIVKAKTVCGNIDRKGTVTLLR